MEAVETSTEGKTMNPDLARAILEREMKLMKWINEIPVQLAQFLSMETILWSNANVHKRGLMLYSREEVMKSLRIGYIA